MCHVCLFDVDGTLIDTAGAGRAAMYRALQTEFGIAELDAGVPFLGRTDRAIVRDLFRYFGIDHTDRNWQRFLRAYCRHLPRTLSERPGRVLAGVPKLLDELSQRVAVFVGLLTGNVAQGAMIKLAHFGLDHYFAFGAFGDEVTERELVAEAALRAVEEHIGMMPRLENIWVIGDTTLDIECARSVGVRVAAVASGGHGLQRLAAARPDLLLVDFSDPSPLLNLLDGLL